MAIKLRASNTPVKHLGTALLLAAVLAGFSTAGCKKQTESSKPNPAAFDTAAPEIKNIWDLALEADRTNDYYAAEVMLYDLTRKEITPEQLQAAKNQLVLTHHRMQDGVEKGDPEAKAAFEKIRMSPPQRPPSSAPPPQ